MGAATGFAVYAPVVTFVVLFFLQALFPQRPAYLGNYRRWLHHALLFVTNTLILRLAVPFTLISVAWWAQQHEFGLFHYMAFSSPFAKASVILVCFVLLDFAVYWQHVATHKIPLLWRLHRVHHADRHMDVTTAIRFHPIELVLSLLYKSLCVILLGAPVLAVIMFEMALSIGAAFSHSNWRMNSHLDTLLRCVIVTPDVHRTHHSVLRAEHDMNYGFFLIWWDRLFSTYKREPDKGHLNMSIGLMQYDRTESERLYRFLMIPFRG